MNLIGIEGKKAVCCTSKEHLAAAALERCGYLKNIARQPVMPIVIAKCLDAGIKSGQPIAGAEPQLSLAVFQNAEDRITRQAVAVIVVRNLPGIRIQARQAAAPSPYP